MIEEDVSYTPQMGIKKKKRGQVVQRGKISEKVAMKGDGRASSQRQGDQPGALKKLRLLP